jgi:glycosyltransferase involved in cell wall biosynthesis
MKVAIIIPAIRHLGPVKVIVTLANELAEFSDVKINLFYLDRLRDNSIKIKVPVDRLKIKSFRFEDYDIIHTNGLRPDLIGFFYRKRIKYHISTIHNYVFEDLGFTYNYLAAYFIGFLWIMFWKRADKLVCVSQSLEKYYTRWFDRNMLMHIYNSVPERVQIENLNNNIVLAIKGLREKGLKVIGSAAVLNRRKGLDQVLNLLANEPDYGYVLFGEGKELAKLIDLSQRLKVKDRFLFFGFQVDAIKYFRLFDVFIMPSRSEGFGLSLVEAVSEKVPVICSDIKVFNEIFSEEQVTFFHLDHIDSLSKALRIIESSGSEKVDKAYNRYIKEFKPEIMAKRYWDIYHNV